MDSSKVSSSSIEKAVDALLKWKSKTTSTQKPKLLPSDEFLYLVLTLNKIPSNPRTNAHRITLPNPLYDPTTSEFCLFVHDSVSKTAKQKVEEQGVPLSKIIKLTKLKKEYKAYEQKRKLCDSFDLFFADKRIIPLLPNAIGKGFYKKKKLPVPIELGHGDWKGKIESVCRSALVYFSTGTCSVIKVAKGSMSKEEIVENVVAAIEGVVDVVPKNWRNVRAFHLKFAESLALPVYQKVPELGMKISGVGENVEEEEKKVVVAAKKKKEVKEKVGRKNKKKGRIHEVKYMDNAGVADMVGEDESGSDDHVEESVSGGKKRKKEVEKVKKGVKGLKENKGNKKFKKSKSLV